MQARDVGVGLLDRDARLQPRDALIAEVADEHLGAIEPERQHERRVVAQEAEALGQHADDLARRAVDHQRLADGVGIAVEHALPVLVAQDHRRRRCPARRLPS